MSKWDDLQKPNQKSKYHGKKDHVHNEKERGLGGKVRGPKPQPSTSVGEPLAGATVFPSYLYIGSRPPITDQGSTPRCVAFSNAYDQNQHDRPEAGAFLNFAEGTFFRQIGGTEDGAYQDDAFVRRRDYGYPVTTIGERAKHRIKSWQPVELTVAGIKAALSRLGPDGRRHGILAIVEWQHSWFHPLASGKLPTPDYQAGYHNTFWDGWNDNYGFRIPNTWGTDYGVNGRCFLPYAFLDRIWGAWQSTDA